ncbi:MAG: hypothetical protein C0518_10940 [Opitutus sp.]|nr:hypothetical protein [Opitutus sp.]
MIKLSRLVLAGLFSAATFLAGYAKIGVQHQMVLGNPSNSITDASNHVNYLIQRDQYALDYNDLRGVPNWVSWNLTAEDVGGSGRSPVFFADPDMPATFYTVQPTDYQGSGYDRGHMCPSADRTVSRADNDFTFYMSNMVPQAPDNNQGVWANFESYCRTLAAQGFEVLIISGPGGFAGSTVPSGAADIPGFVWKVVVAAPVGATPVLDRIDSNTRVIALKIPNIAGIRNDPWQNYVTSAAAIEADTGLQFFTALPSAVAHALRVKIDGQTQSGGPFIVEQPASQVAALGTSVTFNVTAGGNAPLSYQWLRNDQEIPGATSPSLTLNSITAPDAGGYYVEVSNSAGTVVSNAADLIISGIPPSITTQPAAQIVPAGSTITLAVGVTGSPTLNYQWRVDGAVIPGATSAALSIANAQEDATGDYDVIVSNSVGSVTSNLAEITVVPAAPSITTQPTAQTATAGGSASFTVAATGTDPLSYQWRRGGAPLVNDAVISGATTPTLSLTNLDASYAGSYDVMVTNSVGNTTSNAATLTVSAATVYWNFQTATPTSGVPADVTAGALSSGNSFGTTTLLTTTSASSGYTGVSGANNAGVAARIGALNQAASGSAYFEFTLTPAAGKKLVITGLNFGARSTSTGPQAYSIFTSFDNYAAPIATGALLNNSSWRLITPTVNAVTGLTGTPLTVRIYGHNGSGSPASGTVNWRIDDLKVTLATVASTGAVAPAITDTTPASGTTSVAINSAIQVTFNQPVTVGTGWFTIASSLHGPISATVTGGPVSYTLTPPANFSYGDVITARVNAGTVTENDTGTLTLPASYTWSFTTASAVAPAITSQPASLTVSDGAPASFTVVATGTAPLGYQWRRNGTPISGNSTATTATLVLASADLAAAGSYDVVISNPAGSLTSNAAQLTVLAVAPAITANPNAQLVTTGGSASFSVAATGSAPLSYQWRRNGSALSNGGNITGAQSATLTVSPAALADVGSYDVVVTNSAGFATSTSAPLGLTTAALSNAIWNFNTATPSSPLPANITGGLVTQNNNNGTTTMLTSSSVSGSYSGASAGNNAGLAARIGALNRASGGSGYFEFTLTPDAGRQLVLTGINFGSRSTGTGPKAYAIDVSVDGTNFVNAASGTLLSDSVWRRITPNLSGVRGAPGTGVTVRIYGYNGAGSAGTNTANWRIDDLNVTVGTELLPAVVGSSPANGATGVGRAAAMTVTFNQPVNATASAFSVSSTALGNVATTLSGGGASYTLTPVSAFGYSDDVTVTVNGAQITDASGTLTMSGNASFSFTTEAAIPPSITQSPSAQTVTAFTSATFTVGATGTGPLSYQWRFNGSPIAGNASAQTAALTLASVTTADAGDYDCVVNGFAGTVTSAPATLTVNKAAASVTLSNLTHVFSGSAQSATVTTSPEGLVTSVTYNGSSAAPSAAGSYAVSAQIVDANYEGSATGTLLIQQANATITLANLAHNYDGTPKSVTATTTPEGLTVVLTYNGSATAPTLPGSYPVEATIDNANYTGAATGTLEIGITALVNRGLSLSGALDGSVQVRTPDASTLNGNAWISGDLLVVGTPELRANGKPTFAGVQDAAGAAAPSDYRVTLNGGTVLRYLVRRVDAIALPAATTVLAPVGTRNVTLNTAGQPVGDWATVRDLTLNGNAGAIAVPAGAYGALTANGGTRLVLGVVGATEPAVYHLQSLTLNGSSRLDVAGPVVLHLANGTTLNSSAGDVAHPERLVIRIANGGLTLNGSATLAGRIEAPNGTITIGSQATLVGSIAADRLVINGGGVLEQP